MPDTSQASGTKMTLRDFISTYNFRTFHNEKENTQIIRIVDDYENKWFEFGVDDWTYNSERDGFIKLIFNKKLLDRPVASITYDDVAEVVVVYIDEKES